MDQSAGVFADLDGAGAVENEAGRRLASLKDRLRSRLNKNVRQIPSRLAPGHGLDRSPGGLVRRRMARLVRGH